MPGYDLNDNLRRQAAYYEGLLDQHGVRAEALDWNSRSSQELRYRIFQDAFNYTDKRSVEILDVGCGFGDFWGYLKKQRLAEKFKIKYQGIDVSAKLIGVARQKYPEVSFEVKNILADNLGKKFDLVFCSGAFNIRFMEENLHLQYIKDLLLKMFELSKIGVIANFLSASAVYLTAREDLNSGRYYYFRAEEIINLCRFLSSRYILRHDYHPGDFTVYLFRS
jgi:SAM-dependent methyltransferase